MSSTSSTSFTSSTSSTQSLNTTSLFIRVPNALISYSLLFNPYTLPLYLYSAINAQHFHSDIVQTNILLIADTFAPSNPSAPSAFARTLLALSDSSTDTQPLPLDTQPLPFTPPFQFITLPTITSSPCPIPKQERLQYFFLPRSHKMDNAWTALPYDEYFYILERIEDLNNIPSTKTKYNTIELLNLYMYIRQKIQFYDKVLCSKSAPSTPSSLEALDTQKSQSHIPTLYEGFNTMQANTNISHNTLVKYLNQLNQLGLIDITHQTSTPNQNLSNAYTLSSAWKETYYA